jgi:farnesol dehydrogenase
MADAPVLLTGGTGYLGRWILRALREEGKTVRLLARDPAAHRALEAPGVEIVRGDVTDRASLDAASRGAASVVHAAALVTAWEKDASAYERVNVHGLRNAAEAARAAGAAPFLAVSSIFALGPTDGITGDETLPLRGDREFSTVYERTKTRGAVEAEELAKRGHPVITVYPGILYGPGPLREANLVGRLLAEAATGSLPGLPGGGDRRWCFAYVEDVGRGVVAALLRGKPGERYVLGGENATLRAFFDRVADLGGPAVPRNSLPLAALAAMGAAAESLARFGGPRPRITRGAAAMFRHEWAFDSRRAGRALGWTSRGLDAGIPPTLEWLRTSGRDA